MGQKKKQDERCVEARQRNKMNRIRKKRGDLPRFFLNPSCPILFLFSPHLVVFVSFFYPILFVLFLLEPAFMLARNGGFRLSFPYAKKNLHPREYRFDRTSTLQVARHLKEEVEIVAIGR